MKKKSSKKKWIALAVVLVIVILLVVGFLNMQANIKNLAKTTYDIVDVKKDTILVKVKGAGSARPLVDDTVYASVSGTVDNVFAENGNVVSAGDVIVTFTSDALEEQQDTIQKQIDDIDAAIGMMRSVSGSDYIRSPLEGKIKLLYAEKGDSVDNVMEQYGALAVICPDDLLETVVAMPESEVLGDVVSVTMDTVSLEGEVYKIDAQNGEVTIRFEDNDYSVGERVVVTSEEGATLGEGTISIANPIYITAQGGVIERVYEDVGDTVKRGGNLFRLDGDILSAELYDQIQQRKELEEDLKDLSADRQELMVMADTDGVVSGLDLNIDQIVQEGAPLFTIESNKQIKMDVDIDELDIANIQVGQKANVEFDALPEKKHTASVVKINPIGVSVNNVTNYTITLEMDQTEDILLGMSADVEIVSQIAQDVLVIPVEAIQIINGEKYVVFEEDIDEELMYTPATHKIVTGITDGVNIEVLQGLSEGDRVAVPQTKQLSAQEMQQKMMMGGYKKSSSNSSK